MRSVWDDRREILAEYCSQGLSLSEMGRRFGTSHQEDILSAIARFGIPYQRFAQKGANNPAWKGGMTTDKSGYLLVWKPEHPQANSNGYIRKHRLVMEEKLGRPLLRRERVHHKDDHPSNNAPDNLQLYPNNSAHLRETLRGKRPKWTQDGMRRMARDPKLRAMLINQGLLTEPTPPAS